MRNLKKILALALALVMSMSLMATANAFSDDEKITDTYETAVTVLSGLKVFQGYDEGDFRPQGAITRAEVAAIIYRIVTGDVGDTQVGIYADYNKFDDVKSTSWYAGYVNFCANAEYIKGYDAKTFGPNDRVTGYQALAMILRALGYDKNGEFTGTNWQVQTAAVGESQGITKNITAGTLGTPATREVVAEILFRAILVPKATYTPAFGYQTEINGKENTSIGWDTFELEDITGVVVANEYADLYSGSPMDEGETELNVDGESYTLAYATTVEDLGEARHAYVTGETVLAIADAGNTVWTNEGAEADIATSGKCESASGMERDDETEEYINFANETFEYVTDIRIQYRADLNGDGDFDDADEVGTFKKGKELTTDEVEILEGIFEDDDKLDGWVVVGTKELVEENDISNDMTWREFCREYFQDTDTLIEDVDGADNGEWLKVIDNDGDGVADYIFRIDFAMSVIDRISKDGEYTLASLDENDDEVSFIETKIDGGDIKTEDELAEGDVVIYTFIDGNYYMSVAEMVTETVDKKGINSKTETMTCDGTDYVQSHIGYTDDSEYYWDVTDAHTEVTYDLYLDHFGYVRLFIESDYNTFMLLTDGWYEDDNRNTTFRAMYWNVEDEEEQEISITDNSTADEFIYTSRAGEVETWGNLRGAEETYLHTSVWPDVYATNVAGYASSEDGYALKSVEDSAARIDYEVQALTDADLHKNLKSRIFEGQYYDGGFNDSRIQTNTNTQYYLVIRDEASRYTPNGWVVEDVITWTGYANAPAEAKLNEGDTVGYAVTHRTTTDGNYYVADVVVFETSAYADRDTFFVYEFNNWDVAHLDRVEYVWGIGYDDEGKIDDQRVDVEAEDYKVWTNGRINFYQIYDNENVDYIGDNYAAHNIYAGRVTTDWDLEDVDYIQVSGTAAGNLYIMADAPIYKVTWDEADDEYNVDTIDRDDVASRDHMILFTDDDENVEYAISVDASLWDADDDGKVEAYEYIGYVYDLYLRIKADEIVYDYSPDLAAALAKAEADLAAKPQVLADLIADYDALVALRDNKDAMDDFENDEKLALGAMIDRLNTAIAALEEVADKSATVGALNDAWADYKAAVTSVAKAEALDKLAEALLNYWDVKDDLTTAEQDMAAVAEAGAKAEIGKLTVPATNKTKFDDIKAEYDDAMELTASEIKAYDLVKDATGKTTPMADAVKAVVEQYEKAAANMELINALVAAHVDYKLAQTDATEAALLAAYDALVDAKLDANGNSVPYALLDGAGSTAAWSSYSAAYNAAKDLVTDGENAALKAKAEALVAAKATYEANKTDATEDALLVALNAISDEENTKIQALSPAVSGYDYAGCKAVFTDKAAADRNAVLAALNTGITSSTDITANSKASAIAAVKTLAEEILAKTTIKNGSDVTIVEVTYSESTWTVGTPGSSTVTSGNFTITVGASYKGVEVVNQTTTGTTITVTVPNA